MAEETEIYILNLDCLICPHANRAEYAVFIRSSGGLTESKAKKEL